jgi:hypothetical protein
MRTYDTTPMTQGHYVPMFQTTAPSQIADPPEENVEQAPIISEHENVPMTNEHQNEIMEEPVEEVQGQSAARAQEA